MRWLLPAALLCLLPTPLLAQNFGNIPPGTVIGNAGTTPRPAAPVDMAVMAGSVPASKYGFVGDGTTDNTAAFAAIFAGAADANIVFPPGTFRIACPGGTPPAWTSAAGIVVAGAGKGATTIKYDTGCLFPAAFAAPGAGSMNFANHHSELHNLTIDLNTPAVQTAVASPIQFNATGSTTIAGPIIDNVEILNGSSDNMIALALNAYNGGVINGGRISNSRITLVAPGARHNQCVALASWANNAAPGTLNGVAITNNTCVNASMGLDGFNTIASGNDISGYEYGSGIYTNFSTLTLSCSATTITNNTIHDTPPTFDENNVAATGIESSCPNSLIANNILHHLGGAGISSIGDNSVVSGNQIYANGAASTIAAAGSGYGASVTGGSLTWSGSGCTTNPKLTVNTSAAGGIAAVTNVATAGICTTWPSATATTWTPSGGLSAGTGAKIRLNGVVNGGVGGYNTVGALGSTGTCPIGYCPAMKSGISVYTSSTCTSNPAASPIQACGRNQSVTGNTVGDGGGGFQNYGLTVLSGAISVGVNLRGNVLSGLIAAVNNASPALATINSDPTYYNQAVSGANAITSFTWSDLDTASYKSWHLHCQNLMPVTNLGAADEQKIYLRYGFGTPTVFPTAASSPTWANYSVTGTMVSNSAGGTTIPWAASGEPGISMGLSSVIASFAGGSPAMLDVRVGDLRWPTGLQPNKPAMFDTTFFNTAGTSFVRGMGVGTWLANSNPVTGLRVESGTGSASNHYITGQCTLEGKP